MTNIRKSKLLKKNNRRKKKPHKIRTKKGGGESVWPNPRPTSESGLGANKKKIEMSKTNWDKKLDNPNTKNIVPKIINKLIFSLFALMFKKINSSTSLKE